MANTNWENLPSTNTPINATNLNKISDGLVNVSNSVDSTYKTNVIETKNLFNIDNPILINGYVNYNTGVFSSPSASNQKCFIIKVKPNTTYTWSGYSTSSTLGYGVYSSIPSVNSTASSYGEITASKTITTGANDNYLVMFYSSTNATIDFSQLQIEEGSTATTYEPFTYNEVIVNNEKYTDTLNVGIIEDSRSRVNVLHSNNLFDGEIELGSIDADNGNNVASSVRTRSSNFISVKPNTTYYYYRNSPGYRWIIGYNQNKAGITDGNYQNHPASIISIEPGSTGGSFTTTNTTYYIRWYDTSSTELTDNVMINKGSSGLPYEPYVVPSIYVDNEEIYNQNIMNYSTNEQVIGKWIDGKPLYRKVIEITNPQNTNTNYFSTTSLDIKNVVNIKVMVKNSQTGMSVGPYYDSAENYIVMIVSTANYLRGRFGIALINNFVNCYVILEYTKNN